MMISVSMYLLGLAIGIGLGLYAVKDELRRIKKDVIDVYCCRCGKFMFSKDGKGVEGESHGFCDECIEKELKRVMAERVN